MSLPEPTESTRRRKLAAVGVAVLVVVAVAAVVGQRDRQPGLEPPF